MKLHFYSVSLAEAEAAMLTTIVMMTLMMQMGSPTKMPMMLRMRAILEAFLASSYLPASYLESTYKVYK